MSIRSILETHDPLGALQRAAESGDVSALPDHLNGRGWAQPDVADLAAHLIREGMSDEAERAAEIETEGLCGLLLPEAVPGSGDLRCDLFAGHGGSHRHEASGIRWGEGLPLKPKLIEAIEASEPFLLHLIDVVWGEAHENESVPATGWGLTMIAKARATFDGEAPPMTYDPKRCAVCGWTLSKDYESGCHPGNCSQRPRPSHPYDPERASTEAKGNWVAAEDGTLGRGGMTPALLATFRDDLDAISDPDLPAWLVGGARLCVSTLWGIHAEAHLIVRHAGASYVLPGVTSADVRFEDLWLTDRADLVVLDDGRVTKNRWGKQVVPTGAVIPFEDLNQSHSQDQWHATVRAEQTRRAETFRDPNEWSDHEREVRGAKTYGGQSAEKAEPEEVKLTKRQIRDVLDTYSGQVKHTEACRTVKGNVKGTGGHQGPRLSSRDLGGYRCACDWMDRVRALHVAMEEGKKLTEGLVGRRFKDRRDDVVWTFHTSQGFLPEQIITIKTDQVGVDSKLKGNWSRDLTVEQLRGFLEHADWLAEGRSLERVCVDLVDDLKESRGSADPTAFEVWTIRQLALLQVALEGGKA